MYNFRSKIDHCRQHFFPFVSSERIVNAFILSSSSERYLFRITMFLCILVSSLFNGKQNRLNRMTENFDRKTNAQLPNTLYIIRNPRKLYIEISADLVHPGLSEREG